LTEGVAGSVIVEAVEIRVIDIPLKHPFRTSQSIQHSRRAMLARVITDRSEGWADISVEDEPVFGHEFLSAAWSALEELLVPQLLAGPAGAASASDRMSDVVGHPAAKAGLEMALLDAELRAAGMSLRDYFGGVRDRVPVGVSVGITDTLPELLTTVASYVAEGYPRVKLKVQPGWDREPIAAVRAEFGAGLSLQVDGNGAYRSADLLHVVGWDEFGLEMIEQPFPSYDLTSHARLAAQISTPVCLDESIGSARAAAAAIASGACSVVNIKPGRIGGYLEARRVHDVCDALSVPVWCGGVLESGVGRAANLALASLPNFQFPGDISATSRYFAEDICPPFLLRDGMIDVPDQPGIGVDVDLDTLERFTSERRLLKRT
jgi:O-succinylbenzoate synthase